MLGNFPPSGRRPLAALAMLLAAGLPACQNSPWKRSLVYSQAGIAIYKERKFDPEDRPLPLGHAHPVNLPPDRIRDLLASLKYRAPRVLRPAEDSALFTAEEAERLAEPIADALQDISPDERVRFLSVKDEGVLFLASRRGTSGVVFATSPDAINVAFDLVAATVDDQDGDPTTVRIYSDPTADDIEGPRLLLPAGVTFHQEPVTGIAHAHWLVYDPRTPIVLAAAPAAAPAKAPAAATATAPATTAATTDAAAAAPAPSAAVDSTAAAAPTAPRVLFPYKGFQIVEGDGQFHAIADSEGPFDAAKFRSGGYKSRISRASAEELIEAIEAIRKSIGTDP